MSIPATMIFISATGAGGPEVLQLAQGPVPALAAGDVLLRVRAAGVNRPDLMQREGRYPAPGGASPVLGLEVAGEVAALGPDARGIRVGDAVCALTNGGGYAEYCAVPAVQCLPFPAGFDAIQAAALPEAFFTVWANLFGLGLLRPGERVLVHGGASGIGTAAIQLAAAFGATVYATAGGAEKCAACRTLGAAAAFDYRTADFAEEIRRLTDGRGVDVILDIIGGQYAAANLRSLATSGRLVIIALQGGAKADGFDLGRIMLKRLVVTGSTMRPRTAEEKGALAASLRERVWPLLETGQVKPVIYRVFPLAAAAEAHRCMESGAHVGKIVLKIAD